LNNTTIEPKALGLNKTTIESDSKLPALKIKKTPDDELMKLIKRN
jgi:hypothetical protein